MFNVVETGGILRNGTSMFIAVRTLLFNIVHPTCVNNIDLSTRDSDNVDKLKSCFGLLKQGRTICLSLSKHMLITSQVGDINLKDNK